MWMSQFSGAIHTGVGHTQADKMLKILDLPGVSNKTYKWHENVVGKAIEEVAMDSCTAAAKLERKLTLDNVEDIMKLL